MVSEVGVRRELLVAFLLLPDHSSDGGQGLGGQTNLRELLDATPTHTCLRPRAHPSSVCSEEMIRWFVGQC